MGVLPKKFSQTSPDSVLQKAARDNNYGEGGLAKLAHINELRESLVMAIYADSPAALAGGLEPGDLYMTTLGVVCVVLAP